MAKLCRKRDFRYSRVVAKADHADAYKQLPTQRKDERAAAVVLRNPAHGELRDFSTRTLLFGFAAAAPRHACRPRIAALFACRISELPRIGYLGYFGDASQIGVVPEAMQAFTEPNEPLLFRPEPRTSGGGPRMGFLVIAIQFPEDDSGILADPTTSTDRAKGLSQQVREALQTGLDSIACMRKLARKVAIRPKPLNEEVRTRRADTRGGWRSPARLGGRRLEMAGGCITWRSSNTERATGAG